MKDPAALIYIDKWVSATKGMQGNAKGWYLDLILHQFDKGNLPSDLDELASICSIRPSEFILFKQVFEQVLKQKFIQNEDGYLENDFAKEIIQKRKTFKNKRSAAGKVSYLVKYLTENYNFKPKEIEIFKEKSDYSIDFKNKHLFKQMIEQIIELYINVDEDVNKDMIVNKEGVGDFNFKRSLLSMGADKKLLLDWMKVRKDKKASNTKTALEGFLTQVEKSGKDLNEVLRICAENSWKGFNAEWISKPDKEKSFMEKLSEI